jgi:putative ATP-dependent endonuclease of OLD family
VYKRQNIRSTGFKNVAVLFDEIRIRKRCAIVTDLDTQFFDTTPNDDDPEALTSRKQKAIGSEKAGAARKVALEEFTDGNPWVDSYYADHTFEVDFAIAGNHETVAQTVNAVYKQQQSVTSALASLRSGDQTRIGLRTLKMAEYAGKGWFAILLAGKLHHHVTIPDYIRQAILFAHGGFSDALILRILQYRIACYSADPAMKLALDRLNEEIWSFECGLSDLALLRAAVEVALPDDAILPFLAGMT